jgi:N-acetylglucosaminyldiphosphoundecaprenol N-acetyl-beta-D-mannosaminyltransferase
MIKFNIKAANIEPISLFGLRLNTFSDRDVVALIADAIDRGHHYVLGNHNSHSLYLWNREPQLRDFHAIADYVLIDGMSLILLGRLAGLPLRREHRATSLDFMPLLLPEAAKEKWRIYYLGGRPGVAKRAAVKLLAQYPGICLRTHHGYFDAAKSSEENRRVLDDINAYAPDILLVGMGMPRQEIWILENRSELTANIISPCGAHIDYIAGEIPTAPRYLAAIYLEWLYRLIAEPRRLWRRYLIEPWFMAGLVAHLWTGKALLHSEEIQNDKARNLAHSQEVVRESMSSNGLNERGGD